MRVRAVRMETELDEGVLLSVQIGANELLRVFVQDYEYTLFWPCTPGATGDAVRLIQQELLPRSRFLSRDWLKWMNSASAGLPPIGWAEVYLAFPDGTFSAHRYPSILLSLAPNVFVQRLRATTGAKQIEPSFIRMDLPVAGGLPMFHMTMDLGSQEESESLFAIRVPEPLARTLMFVPGLFRASADLADIAPAELEGLRSELVPQLLWLLREYGYGSF